ncbi:hypothetical protein IRB23SM22_20670 [Alkalibacterium sp. s-m-22]
MPVTSDVNVIAYRFRAIGYHLIHMTCWRTNGKETKTYPKIHIPIGIVNWGYPKQKRRKRL